MIKVLTKVTLLALMKNIADEVKDIVLSVDSVNDQIDEIKEITKEMDLLEIILNVEKIARQMVDENKIKQSEEETEILAPMMQVHMKLMSVCASEEIPTVRELASLLRRLQLSLDKYEEFYKDKEGAKMPSIELYKKLFLLINTRIIVQK